MDAGVIFGGPDSWGVLSALFVERFVCEDVAFFGAGSLCKRAVATSEVSAAEGILFKEEGPKDLEGEGVTIRRILTLVVGVVGGCESVGPDGLLGTLIGPMLNDLC